MINPQNWVHENPDQELLERIQETARDLLRKMTHDAFTRWIMDWRQQLLTEKGTKVWIPFTPGTDHAVFVFEHIRTEIEEELRNRLAIPRIKPNMVVVSIEPNTSAVSAMKHFISNYERLVQEGPVEPPFYAFGNIGGKINRPWIEWYSVKHSVPAANAWLKAIEIEASHKKIDLNTHNASIDHYGVISFNRKPECMDLEKL